MKTINTLAPMVFMVGLIFYTQADGWLRWAGLLAVGLAIGWISAAATHD